MPNLIFKVRPAKEHGRSPIEIIIGNKKAMTDNTDELLETLDMLLKRNRIELDTLNNIRVEIAKKAGLTSQRIVKAIAKALSLNL